jgi:hypothetical protein
LYNQPEEALILTYSSVLEDLPKELQRPMLRALEAVEGRMRSELAVRRDDFETLRTTVNELAQAQKQMELQIHTLACAKLDGATATRTD